jgi:hypothetical protein
MIMRFVFTVAVEVERDEGKFAARDEVAEQIAEALEQADPSTIDGVGADGTSTYSVTDWVVEEAPAPKPVRRPKPRPMFVTDNGMTP